MKKSKLFLIFLVTIVAVLCAAVLVACSGGEYSGTHEAPDIKHNLVLPIERNKLTFKKDMEINDIDVIEKCNCKFYDEDGNITQIDAQLLRNGLARHEPFDLETVGTNKRIMITYNGVSNYIFYDVNDYQVNFYTDEEQTELWQTVPASASLNDDLGLSVWVNLTQYNYSVDETAMASDASRAERFNGWYDTAGNSVTGLHALALPRVGNERVLNLHAHYITQEELDVLDIVREGSKRTFVGYKGEATESVVVPEGVTDIDFTKVFEGEIAFEKLHIPSTATITAPFMSAVDTKTLTEVSVDDGSILYSSFNGALYSKDFTTLYFMPASSQNAEFHSSLVEFGSYSCAFWRIGSLTLPQGVTTLQHYCFAYSAISEVQGLENVKQIKTGVFFRSNMNAHLDGNTALYNVLPDGKYVLSMILDKGITSYSILDGTTSIAGDAFKGCTDLTSVTFPNGLERIGESAFSGCVGLTTITLPSSLKYMSKSVFLGCSALTAVNGLPDVTFVDTDGAEYAHTLPSETFYRCSKLTTVTLPEGLITIGPSVFRECSSLENIVFPNSLHTIGSYSFANCTKLTNVSLPPDLRAFGMYAFSACKALERIDLSVCPNLIGLARYLFNSCTKLTSVEIPDFITEIPHHCFYACSGLTEVKMSKVTDIGESAFDYCTTLSKIDFGDSLKTIGKRAFAQCTKGFTSMVIPDTVTDIGGYAFRACNYMTKITLGKNVKNFGVCPIEEDGLTFGGVEPALYLCTVLNEIEVVEGNEYFSSIDGILYARYVDGIDYGKNSVLYAVPQKYTKTEITLPDSVRVIIPYAAHSLTTIKAITLNEGVQNIGKGAFYNSKLLTSMHIPSSVTFLGASILLSCTGIKEFSIAEGNEVYSTDGNLVYSSDKLVMYMGLSAAVEIKDGINEIARAVFMNNGVITSIVIPDSVTIIRDLAFNGCTKLTTIKIGKGLEELESGAFSSIKTLKTIEVDSENPHFKSINDVLYSKDGKQLIVAAANNGMTELDIDENVVEICDYAFAYHKTLSGVKLPSGVKKIGDYAFYECWEITYFYGSPALETIGNRAFSFLKENSVDPTNPTETRFCDKLTRVLLYDKIKLIDDYAFYGQYGIKFLYLNMSYAQAQALKGGKNITYLTYGNPDYTGGGYFNEVIRCLYSATEPDINYDLYYWFAFDENGEPKMYKNSIIRGLV